MNQFKREIKVYENYFSLFYAALPKDVQEKFVYVFRVIKSMERVSEKFLKHIQGEKGLYEIRVEVGSNIYRAFCCFDKGNLVILFNGFQKKTQKTPQDEIAMAKKLMSKYFNEKQNNGKSD